MDNFKTSENKMKIAFTICSNNYLSQAKTLGESFSKFNPDYSFVIGLVDVASELINYNSIPFPIINMSKIGIENLEDMIARYKITELNTAVKPFFFRHFFSQSYESVIYLDPDICVYDKFNEVETALKNNSIVITPHILFPIEDDKLPMERNFLNAGIYNLGFIAVKKTKQAQAMIDWWCKRLFSQAYIDFKSGLFTDQLWINFVPLFFSEVCIFKHPGYNIAYWNLTERKLERQNNNWYVNGAPLVFFHFSGYSPLIPEQLSKYQNRYDLTKEPILNKLFLDYKQELEKNGYNSYIKLDCYYMVKQREKEIYERKKWLSEMSFWKRYLRASILFVIKKCEIDIPK